MKTKPKPAAPAHLTARSKKLWVRLRDEYQLDDAAAEMLLLSALEARDRADQAREAIRQAGLLVLDRFGQARANPACALERDAHGVMVRSLRALRLAPDALE
ncbi:MAG: hypothetical protein KGL43_04140 [Burkholderiales bacterium]|nr:hypothetical protein [Burkholderiales bacterium]